MDGDRAHRALLHRHARPGRHERLNSFALLFWATLRLGASVVPVAVGADLGRAVADSGAGHAFVGSTVVNVAAVWVSAARSAARAAAIESIATVSESLRSRSTPIALWSEYAESSTSSASIWLSA